MYDDFSQTYDRFVNWTNRLAHEMPFILTQLGRLSPPSSGTLRVLDAACGTGWHAIALAERGYRVSAADLSPAMVEKARQNATRSGVAIELKVAGFGELADAFQAGTPESSPPLFDAVLCLGNSLPHVLTAADLKRAIEDLAACLRPGGLLLLQNRNFDAVLARQERWMEPQSYQENGEEWLFLRFYDFQTDGLIGFNIISLHRAETSSWQQHIHRTLLSPQRQSDLAAALLAAHFENTEAFGDMQGLPFAKDQSGNLVLVSWRG